MGPLHGIKIIEFAALGPAPMGAMILADLGAEVVRIERKRAPGAKPASELFDPAIDILNRNRRVVTLDLKKPEGLAAARQLIAAFNTLLDALKANPNLKVDVLQRPVDIESGKSLKGSDVSLDNDKPHAFSLQITRKLKP